MTGGVGDQGEARARRNVVRTSAVAGLAGILFGYDTGIIASALLFVRTDFGLGAFEQGLVVSAVPVGAIFGAAYAGKAGDRIGRRAVILGAAAIFIAGALVSAIAPDTTVLVIARVFLGVAVGLASANAPVYISEVAPPNLRGQLVTYFQLAVTIGILVAYLVGLAFADMDEGWRWMLGLGALPALALGIGMWESPQSPRWLMMVGREPEAREVLERIRPDAAAVDAEVAEIRDGFAQESGGWRDLLAPAVKAALLVGVGLAILQQVTGINTVIYYAPTIIEFTGVDGGSSAILASLGVGVVNIVMTIVAIRLIDRRGRRSLLMIGVTGMVCSLVALGGAFAADESGTLVSAVAIASLMSYVAAFAVSLGPIFWLLNSELYALNVRNKAASVGTMANWAANFVVSLTFLSLIDLLGRAGAFWFYGAVGVVTLWFCWKLVPETKGKRLEEIEAVFEERAAKRGRVTGA